MNIHMTRRAVTSTLMMVALTAPVSSSAEHSGFTITPSVGYIDFDSDRVWDDEIFGSIGLGYKFSNPWQLELVYAEAEAEAEDGSPDTDYKTLHLDALYHLESSGSVTPYLAIGGGHVDYDSSLLETQESNVNAGMGLKIALSDMFSLRTDFRAYHDFDHENLDFAATLGLQVLFGGESRKKTAVAPAPVDGDADKDGVTDSNDQCPGTINGIEVDTNGCALDSDGDGVPNHRDNCPGSEAGALVDAKGCYVMLKEAREIELKVNFASNSDVLPAEYQVEVASLADFLRQYPATQVTIEGHTDSSGRAVYNMDLSERRAKNVAQALVDKHGVDASRVSAVGYGEEKPVADNTSSAGKAANRRVIAVVSTVVEKRAR